MLYGAVAYLIFGSIGACLALFLLFMTHRDQSEIGVQDLFAWAFVCFLAFALGHVGFVFALFANIVCGFHYLYKRCDGWFIENPFYKSDKKWYDEEE